MSLPLPANTTCDIYRNANSPPAAPDVAAVRAHLRPDFAQGREAGEGASDVAWTHVLLVETAVDVRDGWQATGIFLGHDLVWVPDKNGTKFLVAFVERVGRGTPQDHKRVYLKRDTAPWPTNEL